MLNKMYHSKFDENSGEHHSITYSRGEIQAVSHLDVFKLRSVNLKGKNSQVKHANQKETLNLATFLRQPEKAVTKSSMWQKFQLKNPEVEPLGDIETQFIPESPSLEHTLAATSVNAPPLLKEFEENSLDLLNVSKFADRSFDCPPFFHAYDYESRLDPEDYGSVLFKAIYDEIRGEKLVFQRELEYQELRESIGKVDYIMYYIFGSDKTGFFELQRERTMFQESTIQTYTSPLRNPEQEHVGLSSDPDQIGPEDI